LCCLRFKGWGSSYHPAVIILQSFDVLLPKIITVLNLNNHQITLPSSRSMHGANWDRQLDSGMCFNPLVIAQEQPIACSDSPTFTAMLMPLQRQLLAFEHQKPLHLVTVTRQQVFVPTPGSINAHHGTIIKSRLTRARVIAV
jgi:hypothetical protein